MSIDVEPAKKEIDNTAKHPAGEENTAVDMKDVKSVVLKEPLKGGVRRTNTFTASSLGGDKRRNTVAGPRAGHKATVGEASMGNAPLVRAPNMDNIVEYVSLLHMPQSLALLCTMKEVCF